MAMNMDAIMIFIKRTAELQKLVKLQMKSY